MKISYISLYEEIKKLAYELHNITNILSKKNIRCFLVFEKWLFDIETILKKYNMEQVVLFSGLRAKLIGIKNNREIKRSKKLSLVSEVIYESKESFLEITNPIKQKIEDATILIKQCLEIIYQYKLLEKLDNKDFTIFVNSVWSIVIKHEQLKSAGVKLLSLFSKPDILRIIAENINLKK